MNILPTPWAMNFTGRESLFLRETMRLREDKPPVDCQAKTTWQQATGGRRHANSLNQRSKSIF